MLLIEKTFEGADAVILHLKGDMTIETVAELREVLLEVYNENRTQIRLSGRELGAIDFYGLQLLCAAHRTAIKKKILLSWEGGRPSQISDAMPIAGFTRHCGCSLCPPDIKCVWI